MAGMALEKPQLSTQRPLICGFFQFRSWFLVPGSWFLEGIGS